MVGTNGENWVRVGLRRIGSKDGQWRMGMSHAENANSKIRGKWCQIA